MKTIIFYASTYKGNTLKIAKSMAKTLSAELVSIDNKDTSELDISSYSLIGFGSGINFAGHNITLQRFVSELPLQGKNVFIFSTHCRPFLGNYHKPLKGILKRKEARLVGEFSCAGFDRTGPWVAMDGYNKNRPNDKDLFKARLFAEKLQRKLHPLAGISQLPIVQYRQSIAIRQKEQEEIAGNRIVFLNTSTCISCGKCLKICPMNLFKNYEGEILPTNELNCIQCQLCAQKCPTHSIYIDESFINGLRIALREAFSKNLQNSYMSLVFKRNLKGKK